MSMLKQAQLARRAGNVQRYHTQMLLRSETVAQHTFNMLNLLHIVTHGIFSPQLMNAILVHDMGEYATGDIPSPGKRALNKEAKDSFLAAEDAAMRAIHPGIAIDLTSYEHSVLKLCDNLDGLLKCTEERMMGNRIIQECAENYIAYLEQGHYGWGPSATAIINEAIEEYRYYD